MKMIGRYGELVDGRSAGLAISMGMCAQVGGWVGGCLVLRGICMPRGLLASSLLVGSNSRATFFLSIPLIGMRNI